MFDSASWCLTRSSSPLRPGPRPLSFRRLSHCRFDYDVLFLSGRLVSPLVDELTQCVLGLWSIRESVELDAASAVKPSQSLAVQLATKKR
jgi:hypothetical protein